jgi:hypothetical protein
MFLLAGANMFFSYEKNSTNPLLLFDGRCGVVVRILAYYAKGRGFDSRTVQTFVCMNMSVCVYTKNVHKYVIIRYLESIT